MKLYFSKKCQEIIKTAIERNWNEKECRANGMYVEVHHIFPKKLFPELRNKKWNKICVTFEEHFLIHKEMCLSNPSVFVLAHAFNKMCNKGSSNQNRDIEISIEDLAVARKAHADAMSGANNMNKNGLSDEHKKHISESMLGKTRAIETYPNRIIIQCVEHPELVFKSCREAERECKKLGFKGVSSSNLANYFNNKYSHCGKDNNGIKLHWRKI